MYLSSNTAHHAQLPVTASEGGAPPASQLARVWGPMKLEKLLAPTGGWHLCSTTLEAWLLLLRWIPHSLLPLLQPCIHPRELGAACFHSSAQFFPSLLLLHLPCCPVPVMCPPTSGTAATIFKWPEDQCREGVGPHFACLSTAIASWHICKAIAVNS